MGEEEKTRRNGSNCERTKDEKTKKKGKKMEFVFKSVENSIFFPLDVLNFQLNALKEVNLNARWEMKKYIRPVKETYHGMVWCGVARRGMAWHS